MTSVQLYFSEESALLCEEMYQRELAKLKEQQKSRKSVRGKSTTTTTATDAAVAVEEEKVEVVDPQEGDDAAALLRKVSSLLSFLLAPFSALQVQLTFLRCALFTTFLLFFSS